MSKQKGATSQRGDSLLSEVVDCIKLSLPEAGIDALLAEQVALEVSNRLATTFGGQHIYVTMKSL